ncbi:MAG: ORF6N domain-containing protein [Chryseobacterium sp.]
MTKLENELLQIENMIYVIRGQRVMLDSDLAKLYGVETKNLNKAVDRNIRRFPNDFMFQITDIEDKALRFQFGTSKDGFASSIIISVIARPIDLPIIFGVRYSPKICPCLIPSFSNILR